MFHQGLGTVFQSFGVGGDALLKH